MNADGPSTVQDFAPVKQDRLSILARAVGHRLNRRGFLGGLGKGAIGLTAAMAGVLPGTGNFKTALACRYCYECRGPCVFGPRKSSCSQDILTWGGTLIREDCECDIRGGARGQSFAPAGHYSDCPCYCYRC